MEVKSIALALVDEVEEKEVGLLWLVISFLQGLLEEKE